MEVRILKSEEEFLKCRESWGRIYETMEGSTPFQTWAWNYYWWHNHKKGELLVFEIYEAKEIFAYAPFVVIDKRIEFIGEKHFDYGLLVCAERKNSARYQTTQRKL